MSAETAGARAPEAAPSPRRLRRIEPAAIGGVLFRELTVFTRYWPNTTFSAIVEPTIYLLAFGLGLGALLTEVGGLSYIEFIGTGIVATAVLFSSSFPAMFGTFIKRRYQRTYDAILAAPVDVTELVAAEALWLAARAGVFGMAPLLVAIFFGLDPTPGMLLVPPVGFLTGLGFALFGMFLAGFVKAIDNFNYVISAVLTPLFLAAGTFFPVANLPGGRYLALLNPLFHCVQLVRGAVFGIGGWAVAGHVLGLVVFALIMGRLAISWLTKRLID